MQFWEHRCGQSLKIKWDWRYVLSCWWNGCDRVLTALKRNCTLCVIQWVQVEEHSFKRILAKMHLCFMIRNKMLCQFCCSYSAPRWKVFWKCFWNRMWMAKENHVTFTLRLFAWHFRHSEVNFALNMKVVALVYSCYLSPVVLMSGSQCRYFTKIDETAILWTASLLWAITDIVAQKLQVSFPWVTKPKPWSSYLFPLSEWKQWAAQNTRLVSHYYCKVFLFC